jgi:hypothetical protein
MNLRAFFCAAALAVTAAAAQGAAAQEGIKIGALRCNVSGGLGLIITSSRDMRCLFTSRGGHSEYYYGTIRKFGLDIGATTSGVLLWDVFTPTGRPLPGALAGDYIGAQVSATVGAGLGANALVGGFNRSFTLQPLSVQAQAGLALSAGVASMSLRLAHR